MLFQPKHLANNIWSLTPDTNTDYVEYYFWDAKNNSQYITNMFKSPLSFKYISGVIIPDIITSYNINLYDGSIVKQSIITYDPILFTAFTQQKI